MKILHVLTDTNIGGAGKYALALADWANRHDKWRGAVEIILPQGSLLKPEFEARRISVTETPFINDISFHPKAIGRLCTLMRVKNPDIVHTHAALSGRIAGKLCRRRVISTRHSVFDVVQKETRFPRRQLSGLLNGILSDAIIAVSPAALENLIAIGVNAKKIHVIVNGACPVEPLPYEKRLEIKKSYGLQSNAFVVSLIARLTEVKGHDTVLDAAKIIARKDSEIVFLFAGAGPLESHIKRRIRQENLTNVIACGFVQKIAAIENITDIQINASYGTEATSLALLEGMSLGIPSVVSDFGGNPYVIESGVNGLIFAKKDSSALAQAILTLKRDQALYKKTSLGAKRVFAEKYTLDLMGEKTYALYDEIMRRKSVDR